MMVFLQYKLAFFATPKTASTSIEKALDPLCDIRISKNPRAKHTSYRKYKRLLEPFVLTLTKDAIESVSMIREPLDWLGSWYRFRSRDALRGKDNSTAEVSFNQFIEGYLSDSPPAYARVGSQIRFLSNKDGQLEITHLYRYEDLGDLCSFFEERFKRKINLNRANTSPEADLQLAPSLLTDLKAAYAKDFDIYESLARRA